jgi:hypothetical protein
MNDKILKLWIKELKAFAKEPQTRHLQFPMRMESVIGDLLSPEGILCNLHSKETGTKWFPEPSEKGQLRGYLTYCDSQLVAPEEVLEWIGISDGGMSAVRRQYSEGKMDGLLKYLESLE